MQVMFPINTYFLKSGKNISRFQIKFNNDNNCTEIFSYHIYVFHRNILLNLSRSILFNQQYHYHGLNQISTLYKHMCRSNIIQLVRSYVGIHTILIYYNMNKNLFLYCSIYAIITKINPRAAIYYQMINLACGGTVVPFSLLRRPLALLCIANSS